MRLNKYLAGSGVASRRKCETIIHSGRVKVNGIVVTNPFHLLIPGDDVLLDNRIISLPRRNIVICLNKPVGVVSTVEDKYSRKTVTDIIGHRERLFPVGRLDKDSSGVLLLTNDGDLTYQLTHPKFGVEKIYTVVIDRPLERGDIGEIESGVEMGEGEIGRAKVLAPGVGSSRSDESETEVRLSLTHGKKREIRRIFAALGYTVMRLHRESFGGIQADDLSPGEWRELTAVEMDGMMKRLSSKK